MTSTVINTYAKGELIRVSGVLRDSAGALTDPTALTFTCKKPDGTSLSYTLGTDNELVLDSSGNYHVDVDAEMAGTWRYRFAATGTGQSAAAGQFRVKPSFED